MLFTRLVHPESTVVFLLAAADGTHAHDCSCFDTFWVAAEMACSSEYQLSFKNLMYFALVVLGCFGERTVGT